MGRQHDLLIITDATASMGNYLTALQASIPEILALSRLSGLFTRVGVLAYRDYNDESLIEWSGWDKTPAELLAFVAALVPVGGGDYPEAAKTAMIHALQKAEYMDKSKETVVLFYTDAPPHHSTFGGTNYLAEKRAFKAGAADWVTIAFTARARHLRVFSFISSGISAQNSRFYALLSQVTGGVCVTTSDDSQAISRITIDVLLNWMGAVEPTAIAFEHKSRALSFEVSPLNAQTRPKVKDEDYNSAGYLPGPRGATAELKRDTLNLVQHVPRAQDLDAKLVSLGKRFADTAESEYRALVYSTLREIISHNVAALTYNAVFGQLWRAVCREPTPDKEAVVLEFGRAVGKITDADQRKDMTNWLEQSYDASAEIEEMMKEAKDGCQWMYLDLDAQVELTRVELLEASRSFHRGVLRKLASIFTHAKILESDVVLTEHQRAIPLGLPARKIFRLLPHLVVPGTLYSARASSVMAILALAVGVPFLQEAATTVAGYTRGTWLDPEHPETLSWECAAFLLASPNPDLCLTPAEKEVYAAMRRYRMLELNLDATLEARVPWTPQKARGVGDMRVACTRCNVMRSFTIMSNDSHGMCGFCAGSDGKYKVADYPSCDEKESCWVECSSRVCHAQYVVEMPQSLNVRAKCWYCRNKKPCPWLECTACSNRIIVPKRFAPKDGKPFVCPACTTGLRAVFEDLETNARALMKENGVAWLGVSDAYPDSTFKGLSAFKLFQALGKEFFLTATITPGSPGKSTSAKRNSGVTATATSAALVLKDKRIQNPDELRSHLDARVGRGEVARATCALCFDDFAPDRVGPACGRSGCAQRACPSCLEEWYGGNKPGTLLNTRQLTCPFCSRVPVAKIVLHTNRDVCGLMGIKEALADRAWFYAWCGQCSTAKQCIERRCTADGRLPPIDKFICEDCQLENERAAEKARRELRELELLLARIVQEERTRAKRELALRRMRELQAIAVSAGKGNSGYTVRPCPNPDCGVMVNKEFGCDHITCICGAHWCYICGWLGDSASDVYGHLGRHGGYY